MISSIPTNNRRSHPLAQYRHPLSLGVLPRSQDAQGCPITNTACVPCCGEAVTPAGEYRFQGCEGFSSDSGAYGIIRSEGLSSNFYWDDLIGEYTLFLSLAIMSRKLEGILLQHMHTCSARVCEINA